MSDNIQGVQFEKFFERPSYSKNIHNMRQQFLIFLKIDLQKRNGVS